MHLNNSCELANKKKYDTWADSYDTGTMSRWFQYTHRLAISFLELKKGSKVLDVGCATGEAALYLCERDVSVTICGIDISGKMVERAKEKMAILPPNRVEYKQASVENIPYNDNTFDAVLCANAFHHFPSPKRSLEEVQRVLKPGGQLVVLDTARNFSPVLLWNYYLKKKSLAHICYYSVQELKDLLDQSGFKETELVYYQNEFMKHGKVFDSLQIWSGKTNG